MELYSAKYNDLYNGSLAVTEQIVDFLKSMNKIGSISVHVDMYHLPDYYWRYRDIREI